jgi:hypothetical protein
MTARELSVSGRRCWPQDRRARTALVSTALAGGVLAAGLAALALTTAGPAQAAGTIAVQASSPATSVGSLSISLTTSDDADITGFTAHILTASGTDVLDLPESQFTMTSGTAAAGTWTISTPITTSDLLLGTYAVTVDATDADGDSVTGAAAGQLAFLIQPTVTLTATPAGLSYSDPTTTLSGTVTGLMPDGSTTPLSNQHVQITDSGGRSGTTQTDSAGDFSMAESYASTFTASVQGSTIASASSAPLPVNSSTAATNLTATVSTAQATFDQQITVSGNLSYQPQPGASYQGLTGVSVVVLAPGYPELSVPVTDSGGNFTATFTATQSGPVQVYFNDDQYSEGGSYPFLMSAQATTASVSIGLPTALTGFSAAVARSGTVSVRGCLGVTGISPQSAFTVEGTITIQYAASRSGPWRELGTITQTTPGAGDACGVSTAEASFSGAFAARLPRAYYRASFTPESGADWQSSVSSSALAWKYRTEIKSLKVSRTRLAKGRKLTVSGQLLQDRKHWVPFAGQAIEIIFRKQKTKTWSTVVRVRTNSQGRFTVTVKDAFTGLWSASYAGGSSDYAAEAPGIKVTVT